MNTESSNDSSGPDPLVPAAQQRAFLGRSAVLLSLLGGFEEGPLGDVISRAMEIGDIEGALRERGSGLPESVRAHLSTLSIEDLRMVATLQQRLREADASAGGLLSANNGGVGM